MDKQRRPMKTSNRFLLGIGSIFVIAGIIIVALVNNQARKLALVEAETKARIILNHNLATHTYFTHQLKPKLFRLTGPISSDAYFEPTWMSSTYAVREIVKYFKSLEPGEYYYKECAINARSPENEADEHEKSFIEELKANSELMTRSAKRVLNAIPYLVVLHRGEVMEESCLRCHGAPEKAPGDLVRYYGLERSFNRKIGEVVSANSIRIPLSAAYTMANRFSLRLSIILLTILGALFVLQYWFNKRLLFKPLSTIHQRALLISNSDEHLGEEIPLPPSRELNELTAAFNKMSIGLRHQIDHLEERVRKRTSELTKANNELKNEIEARKKTEEALVQARNELEKKVAERTAELTKANQQLQCEIEDRNRIYEELRQAELRYRTMADFTYDWEWWENPDGTFSYVSPSCERITGYSVEAFMDNPKLLDQIILPEDRNVWSNHRQETIEEKKLREIQFRILRKDGEICWIEHACQQVLGDRGEFLGFRASNRDITVRKQSEDALQASRQKAEMLASKLLSAQEVVSARIARELHDDITQRLAFLNVEVDKVEMKKESLPEPVRGTLRQISRDLGTLSSDIHIISRKLHPTNLSILGLVRAIEDECKKFSRLRDIPVTLDLDSTLKYLSKEISLCTYRILQEGLRNIARHSKATAIQVTLSKQNHILHLLIRDNGIGFDPTSNRKEAGLGLVSMAERARLIQADLSIESQPGKGTAIKLTAPLTSRNEAWN